MLAAKRAKARDAPELFAAYGILAAEHSSIAAEHVAARFRWRRRDEVILATASWPGLC